MQITPDAPCPPANAFQLSASTISLGSHQNIGLHTGARANVVFLTYLLKYQGKWRGLHEQAAINPPNSLD